MTQSDTIDEHEYRLENGGRVTVTLERRPHSNTLDLRVRHYNEDDTRMGYFRFHVGSEDSHEARYVGDDRPSDEAIAAVHDMGYTIPNVPESILSTAEVGELDPFMVMLDIRNFALRADEYTNSQYVKLMLEGLSDVAEQIAVNLFLEVAEDGPLDEAVREKNREIAETRPGSGPKTFQDIVEGNFQFAVNKDRVPGYKRDSHDEIIGRLEEMRQDLEHESVFD